MMTYVLTLDIIVVILMLILFHYHEIARHLLSVETLIFISLLKIFSTPHKEVFIIYFYVLGEKFLSISQVTSNRSMR